MEIAQSVPIELNEAVQRKSVVGEKAYNLGLVLIEIIHYYRDQSNSFFSTDNGAPKIR